MANVLWPFRISMQSKHNYDMGIWAQKINIFVFKQSGREKYSWVESGRPVGRAEWEWKGHSVHSASIRYPIVVISRNSLYFSCSLSVIRKFSWYAFNTFILALRMLWYYHTFAIIIVAFSVFTHRFQTIRAYRWFVDARWENKTEWP